MPASTGVGRAITQENKWHAQRYGVAATFVDPFSRSPLDAKAWLDQVLDFIAEDIEALGLPGRNRPPAARSSPKAPAPTARSTSSPRPRRRAADG